MYVGWVVCGDDWTVWAEDEQQTLESGVSMIYDAQGGGGEGRGKGRWRG